MQYLICQIGSRQYLVKPGQTIEIDKVQGEPTKLSIDQVLLRVTDNKVEIGKPFLKEAANFEVIETIKKPKVRVAIYKPKANYRRVTGQRRQVTLIKLSDEAKPVKK